MSFSQYLHLRHTILPFLPCAIRQRRSDIFLRPTVSAGCTEVSGRLYSAISPPGQSISQSTTASRLNSESLPWQIWLRHPRVRHVYIQRRRRRDTSRAYVNIHGRCIYCQLWLLVRQVRFVRIRCGLSRRDFRYGTRPLHLTPHV